MKNIDKSLKNKLLKVADASELLSVSPSFLYLLIHRHEMPAVKIGNALRIRRSDLDAFVESKTINISTHLLEYNGQ
jgi:excisionase family DNA binding protein